MSRVRIVKADAHNYAVEKFVPEHEGTGKGSGRLIPDAWENIGYFGGHLDWAVNKAAMEGFDNGDTVTPESLKEIMAAVVAETKAALS